jgi:hypothetical protein
MSKFTEEEVVGLSEVGLGLDDLVRRGAPQVIQQTIEAELSVPLERFENVKTLYGQRAVVRNGYPAAKADIPELANVKYMFVKAATRMNNQAENSHQPTRERERRMRGFRDPKRTQKFLSCFGPIGQHFALKRHLLRVAIPQNSSLSALPHGMFSPNSPKIRHPSQQTNVFGSIVSSTVYVTTPSRARMA